MRKIILDLDTGIDDAMALAYIAGSEEAELLGVTGTFGNVYTQKGVENALMLLHLLGREEVPVYPGARHAINRKRFLRQAVSARIHGENGVGQISLPPSQGKAEEKDAVSFLCEAIRKHKKELTIVTTGPLTNLALALQKEPEIKALLGPVVVMGGALTVEGNVSPFAEANISQDPHGAKLIFESGLDVTMVGLDVTLRSRLTRADTQKWRDCGSLAGKLFADMVDYYISQHFHSNKTACFLHDPSAAVCALHPEYFQYLPLHLTVCADGGTLGRTVADCTKLRCPDPKTKVCVGVDSEALEQELNRVLLKLFQQ